MILDCAEGVQPNRCPEAPEGAKLRHLPYGSKPHIHRVIYRVTEKSKRADVLDIRHGARQSSNRSEVE